MLLVLIAVIAVLAWRKFHPSASTAVAQPAEYPDGAAGNLGAISNSIANVEGFFLPNSLAARSNNPGNVGTFGGKVASYPSTDTGWAALNDWITNHAAEHPDWDFYDMMHYYATGDTLGQGAPGFISPDTYAEQVAASVGVDPTTPVSQVL